MTMPQNGVLRLFTLLAVLCAVLALSEPSWGGQDAQRPYPGYRPFDPKRPPTESATIYGPHNKVEGSITGNTVYGKDNPNKPLYQIQQKRPEGRNSTDPSF